LNRQGRLPITLCVVCLIALSFALRGADVDAMVNVDMYYLWSKRVVGFIQGLESGRLSETYQSHHPGVTFMWLTGLIWKCSGTLLDSLDPDKLRLAVLPVLVVGTLFPASTYLLTLRALGDRHHHVALLTGALLATEPLLVAHSRNAHLDMLVTAFAWTAVLASLIALREGSVRWAVMGGAALGCALLTKVSSAGIALGIALCCLLHIALYRGNRREIAQVFVVIVVAATCFVLVLWPALWVAPIATIEKLWVGANHEVEKATEFMLFGTTGRLSLPKWVYGLLVAYLVTPEVLVPAVLAGAYLRSSNETQRVFVADIVTAVVPLMLALVLSTNVGTRYILPILPMIGTLAALAIVRSGELLAHALKLRHAHYFGGSLASMLILARILRLTALHPLPITYCANWFGVDCAEVFHIGWGEGLREASSLVAEQTRLRSYDAPPRIFGGSYAGIMRLWTPISMTRTFDDAQLLVEYLPDRQRRLAPARAIAQFVEQRRLTPLGEVKLAGRTYVRIFAGPAY